MRILNEPSFKLALSENLAQLGDLHPKYVSWVKDSVLKWLLKNSPQFVETFCTQVFSRKNTTFGDFMSWHYKDIDGVVKRAHLENEFDQKDSAAGTLYYFLPKQSVAYWLFHENPVMIDARDFFSELLEDKPETDLRKYTLETLPRQMEVWRRDRDARILREQQRRLAELQRMQTAAEEAEAAILQALSSSEQVIRKQQLALAWTRFIAGTDYNVLGTVDGFEVLSLLTPRALDWESAYKGNCMDGSGYKQGLHSAHRIFLSLRRAGDPTDAVYTMEVNVENKRFHVMQCEVWGYRHPGYGLTQNEEQRKAISAAIVQFLPQVPLEKIKPKSAQNTNSEFVVNRVR